ncbi:MAG TPA: hypothetical protein VMU81_22150 [Acetobacteraceae bacterium]|nr:hypothetical protein [Acetobacteraceae bacterium]
MFGFGDYRYRSADFFLTAADRAVPAVPKKTVTTLSATSPAGDDYLNDHEPIGSVHCVVEEAGIYQKVLLVDLEKAVKAVGSVVAGGHLGF